MIGATLLLYGNKDANLDHSPPRLQPETETKPTQLYPQEYPTVKLTVAEKAQPEPAPIAQRASDNRGTRTRRPKAATHRPDKGAFKNPNRVKSV